MLAILHLLHRRGNYNREGWIRIATWRLEFSFGHVNKGMGHEVLISLMYLMNQFRAQYFIQVLSVLWLVNG